MCQKEHYSRVIAAMEGGDVAACDKRNRKMNGGYGVMMEL